VYKPSVILLDEPLGALDKNLREHMQLEIRGLHRDLGATFIYVTHDQEEALAMSDRICLMNQARVEQIGVPNELYDKPVSRFAAAFLGHSNILDGDVEGRCLRWRGHGLPLPATGRAASGKVSLLVRPESARLSSVEASLLQGRVVETVFTGADLRVIVQVGPEARFTVRTSRAGKPELGTMVGIAWDPDDTILLHK
jgi:putative spermidine/putrescine transport system ATP-binding protein